MSLKSTIYYYSQTIRTYLTKPYFYGPLSDTIKFNFSTEKTNGFYINIFFDLNNKHIMHYTSLADTKINFSSKKWKNLSNQVSIDANTNKKYFLSFFSSMEDIVIDVKQFECGVLTQ